MTCNRIRGMIRCTTQLRKRSQKGFSAIKQHVRSLDGWVTSCLPSTCSEQNYFYGGKFLNRKRTCCEFQSSSRFRRSVYRRSFVVCMEQLLSWNKIDFESWDSGGEKWNLVETHNLQIKNHAEAHYRDNACRVEASFCVFSCFHSSFFSRHGFFCPRPVRLFVRKIRNNNGLSV